jgi:hypothetical protein
MSIHLAIDITQIAHLITMLPSILRVPFLYSSSISWILMCALVCEIVGRISMPSWNSYRGDADEKVIAGLVHNTHL